MDETKQKSDKLRLIGQILIKSARFRHHYKYKIGHNLTHTTEMEKHCQKRTKNDVILYLIRHRTLHQILHPRHHPLPHRLDHQ